MPQVITDTKSLPNAEQGIDPWSRVMTLAGLFKPRIVLLLLVSALSGAFLGAHGWPGAWPLLLLVLTGGLSAAGSSAVNQYLERERDGQMVRTRRRVLPSGAVKNPLWVLIVGSGMVICAVGIAAVFNPALALSNALGAIIYLGIYTLLLKPRTILNIVIGGAAGSMAVISGGAAVHAWNDPGVLVLSLLVFTWTPTHFWSLAIAYREDYARAGFPMLPVNITPKQAAWWVAVHTLATGFIALVLGFHPALGIAYLLPIGLITFQLFRLTAKLLHRPHGKVAFNLFKFSNIYLGIVQLFVLFLPLFK
jgi:protoheme IX farnesyltransferase